MGFYGPGAGPPAPSIPMTTSLETRPGVASLVDRVLIVRRNHQRVRVFRVGTPLELGSNPKSASFGGLVGFPPAPVFS